MLKLVTFAKQSVGGSVLYALYGPYISQEEK